MHWQCCAGLLLMAAAPQQPVHIMVCTLCSVVGAVWCAWDRGFRAGGEGGAGSSRAGWGWGVRSSSCRCLTRLEWLRPGLRQACVSVSPCIISQGYCDCHWQPADIDSGPAVAGSASTRKLGKSLCKPAVQCDVVAGVCRAVISVIVVNAICCCPLRQRLRIMMPLGQFLVELPLDGRAGCRQECVTIWSAATDSAAAHLRLMLRPADYQTQQTQMNG